MGISMNNNLYDAMTGTVRSDDALNKEIPKTELSTNLSIDTMNIDYVEKLTNWIVQEIYPEKLEWSPSRRSSFKKSIQRFSSANPGAVNSRNNVIDMINGMLESGLIDVGISHKLALGITLY